MITVLLATRNGENTLARTLDALARLEHPACGWEMIAVDNGSTDRTPELLAAHRDRLPLTILREPRAGKSAALNTALPVIRGTLTVFVDDDILPAPDWLRQYAEAASANPGVGVFGGRILPCWEEPPPAWLLTCVDLSVCYGIHVEYPDGPCPYYIVYGGSMAVRSDLLRQGHRFDEAFGPDASASFAMGGETEFVLRLVQRGAATWHCRRAAVRHIVPAEHMEEAWLLRRAVNFGRGEYRLGGETMSRLRNQTESGIAAHLGRGIAANRWRARLAAMFGQREARFRALWRMNHLAGMAHEHRRAWTRRAHEDAALSPSAHAGAGSAATSPGGST